MQACVTEHLRCPPGVKERWQTPSFPIRWYLLKPQWYPCLGTFLFPFLYKGVQKFPRLRSQALWLTMLHPSFAAWAWPGCTRGAHAEALLCGAEEPCARSCRAIHDLHWEWWETGSGDRRESQCKRLVWCWEEMAGTGSWWCWSSRSLQLWNFQEQTWGRGAGCEGKRVLFPPLLFMGERWKSEVTVEICLSV